MQCNNFSVDLRAGGHDAVKPQVGWRDWRRLAEAAKKAWKKKRFPFPFVFFE